MRISDWAQKFNLAVKRCEERPDHPQGEIVYRVKDVFTTLSGSWEPSADYGAIPQWARDAYLKPWGADDYFEEGGADHNLFALVLDLEGKPVKAGIQIRYWPDGFDKLGDAGYTGYLAACSETPFGLGQPRHLEQLQPRKRRTRRVVLVPRRRGGCHRGRRDAQQPSRFHLRRLAGRTP